MKIPHWLSILLGALVAALTQLETSLPAPWGERARLLVMLAGAALPMLAVTSPSALRSGNENAVKKEGGA